jgi:hypothetical protein
MANGINPIDEGRKIATPISPEILRQQVRRPIDPPTIIRQWPASDINLQDDDTVQICGKRVILHMTPDPTNDVNLLATIKELRDRVSTLESQVKALTPQ